MSDAFPCHPEHAFPGERRRWWVWSHSRLLAGASAEARAERAGGLHVWLLAELERVQPRYAVVYRYARTVDGIRYGVALPEVRAHLIERYELDADFGSFLLLRRKT